LHLVALYDSQSEPVVIECKWKAAEFDGSNIISFRRHNPKGDNFVVSSDIIKSFSRSYDNVQVRFVSLRELIKAILA